MDQIPNLMGYVTSSSLTTTLASYAPLASPAFTGTATLGGKTKHQSYACLLQFGEIHRIGCYDCKHFKSGFSFVQYHGRIQYTGESITVGTGTLFSYTTQHMFYRMMNPMKYIV